ncbi:MAG: hypothetical protein COA99_15935, partial [Moraxellaceae bacterium]
MDAELNNPPLNYPPLRQGLWGIFKRDIVIAFRHRSDMVNPLFFFIMVITLFPLGVGPEPSILIRIGPGVL